MKTMEDQIKEIRHCGECAIYAMVNHKLSWLPDDGGLDDVVNQMHDAQSLFILSKAYYSYINLCIQRGYSDGHIIGGIMQNDKQNLKFNIDIDTIIKVLIDMKRISVSLDEFVVELAKDIKKRDNTICICDEEEEQSVDGMIEKGSNDCGIEERFVNEEQMTKSNLRVNENCIQCGSCLGCGYEFLNSANEGSIIVESGTILDSNSEEFKNLQDICPVGAFVLDSSISKKSMLDALVGELKNYKGVPNPTEKDLKFRKEEYSIPIPCASGENRYEYMSESSAERAALGEFERAMYSQVDNIILRVITEYRVKYIKPYYTDCAEEGSVYAKSNRKVSEVLEGINKLVGGKMPDDFTKVDVYPSQDMYWKMLNKGEVISDEVVSAVKSEFDYSSSEYFCKWRTDFMEVADGKDWRGNIKTKEKYCYKQVRGAFQELAKDILDACSYASGFIEHQAVEKAGYLVDVYNKELESVIEKKMKLLSELYL